MENNLDSFVELIKSQFNEKEQEVINEFTNITQLNEWSSLQTMIVVNEIDKLFGVILNSNDFKTANSIKELYDIVQQKKIN